MERTNGNGKPEKIQRMENAGKGPAAKNEKSAAMNFADAIKINILPAVV